MKITILKTREINGVKSATTVTIEKEFEPEDDAAMNIVNFLIGKIIKALNEGTS